MHRPCCERIERRTIATKFSRRARIRPDRRPRAGLDQHHRRSPQRQVVPERTELELVVIAADLPRCERSSARGTAQTFLVSAPFAARPRLVECHRQQEIDAGRGGRPTDVRQAWLCN